MEDKAAFKAYVKRKLGDGVVNVELTTDQLEDIWTDTLQWFSSRRGVKDTQTFNTAENVTEYSVVSTARNVLDVIFPGQASPATLSDVTSDVLGADVGRMAGGQSLVSPSTVALEQQTEMDRNLMIGTETSWDFDQIRRKLIISPVPTGVQTLMYVYVRPMVEGDLPNLDNFENELFTKYGIALGKITLGRIRTKFGSGFETAMGNVTLDGDTLLSEGREDIETLEEKIRDYSEPMGFVTG